MAVLDDNEGPVETARATIVLNNLDLALRQIERMNEPTVILLQ